MSHLPKGIENHVLCEETLNLDQFGLPSIHSLSNAPRWRYYWDKGLRRLHVRDYLEFYVKIIKMLRADILHSHFGYIGWANIETAKKSGVKHLVSFYGVDVSRLPAVDPLWQVRYRDLFKQVDGVLCLGSQMGQRVLDLGCPEKKIRVFHLGVETDRISFKPREWDRTEPLRVLIAATFREKKGIPYALEALGWLHDNIPLEITIIGDATKEKRSQEEKQKILAVIQKYNFASKVRLLGYQPHSILFEEAYKHHIFLLPSVTASDGDSEGTPVTIMEMAATGMPVISTRHSDIPAIVQHSHTGLLADERDVYKLVEHLKWFIQHPDRWRKMVEAGRRHIEEQYNLKIQGEKLATVYQELIEG